MYSSFRFPLITAGLVALSGALAHAGVITGQLLDAQGSPVRNAMFQVEAMSGNDSPFVSGGFSDANGNFTTTITPDGAYRVTVFPQPPPLSNVVTKRFENITVSPGTTALGALALENGVTLSGRVVNLAGTPLVSVGLEFKTPADSQFLDFTNGETNAAGYFSVTVPYGPCVVGFEPGPVPYYGGPSTGPRSLSLDVTEPIAAGDVVMPLGFSLAGVVTREDDGTPVEDVLVEAVDAFTGAVQYTPKNRTNAGGGYVIMVAAGVYDIHFVPHSNEGLVAATIANRIVPPSASLPPVAMVAGVELRGRVRGADNVGYPGVAIELFDAVTHGSVFVENAVSGAGGNYSVQVPPGTYDITFSAPFSIPFGAATVHGVFVDPNDNHTTQNGTLPSVPFSTTTGNAVAGLGGVAPLIASSGGTPRLGNLDYKLEFTQAHGAARGIVIYSIESPSAGHGTPFMRRASLFLGGAPHTPGAGSGTFALPIPDHASLAGMEVRARLLVRDNAALFGQAMTQELVATIAP